MNDITRKRAVTAYLEYRNSLKLRDPNHDKYEQARITEAIGRYRNDFEKALKTYLGHEATPVEKNDFVTAVLQEQAA